MGEGIKWSQLAVKRDWVMYTLNVCINLHADDHVFTVFIQRRLNLIKKGKALKSNLP